MSKLNLKLLAVCLAFVALSPASYADAPDYSKKKSGGVAFSKEKEDSTDAQENQQTDPSQIEPAAGAYEEEQEKETSLADDIKLPRK